MKQSRPWDCISQKNQKIPQNTIDRNRRHPGYQPTGNSGAGYAAQGDFSRSGQEKAYQKLKELQKNLRLG
jgi:hypothetical protein